MIIAGDLNIAPLKNDVWSHKQLLNIVSHTPIEVEKLLNSYKSIGLKILSESLLLNQKSFIVGGAIEQEIGKSQIEVED